MRLFASVGALTPGWGSDLVVGYKWLLLAVYSGLFAELTSNELFAFSAGLGQRSGGRVQVAAVGGAALGRRRWRRGAAAASQDHDEAGVKWVTET